MVTEGPWCQILSFIQVFLESIDLHPRKEDTETNLGQIYLNLSRFIYDQENSFLLSHKGLPRIKIGIITCWFIFKDFALDIKKFHQEHREESKDIEDNLQMASNRLGNSLSAGSLKPCINKLSSRNLVVDELKTVSMMTLEDMELNYEDNENEEKYTKEERMRIHKG